MSPPRALLIRGAIRFLFAGSPARGPLAPFEFGDEEDFAPLPDRLEISGLVDGAVDRDGGFLYKVLAEAGVEAVHFPDNAAQVPRFDGEFAHAAGVAATE